MAWKVRSLSGLLLAVFMPAHAGPVFSVQSAGGAGFDVLADGVLVAPIRLAADGAIRGGHSHD